MLVEPAHVDNAVFSTLPNPIVVLVILCGLEALA
jgi:hypothetical protein